MNGNTTLDAKLETYRSFLNTVKEFEELDAIPNTFKCTLEETPESFAQNYASWHKSCRVKLYDGKLSRAKKRRKEREQDPENEKGRNNPKRKTLYVAACIFCKRSSDESGEDLHEFPTLEADANVIMMATNLQDTVRHAPIIKNCRW